MSSIYDLIQQKANNHEDPVPPDAWEHIRNKKRRRRPVFFWMLAGMLLFGLLIGGYFYFDRNKDTGTKNLANKESQLNTKPNNTTKQNNSNKPVQPANQDINANRQTTITEGSIAGNNQDNQTNPVVDKQGQPTGNIQQANKNNVANSRKSTIKGKATVHSSYEPAVPEEPGKAKPAASGKKITNKEKGKALVVTTQGETGELTAGKENDKDVETMTAIATDDKANNEVAVTQENTDSLSPPLQVEKITRTEPIQQQKAATALNENKKQEKQSKKPASKHPWFIDFTITPVIPIQQYDEDINFSRTLLQEGARADFTGKLEDSHIDPSVAFSISVGKEINKKFSASIGLQYLQLKEHVSVLGTQTNTYYKYIINQVMLDGGPGEMIDTITLIQHGNRKFSAINSYRFLTIPVSVQYKFMQQNLWSMAVTAGVNINVYSKYNNEINLNPNALLVNTSQTIPATTGVSYALAAGVRIERKINKQFSVFGNPSFSYMMGKQPIKNSLFNTKIHQFGIGLGLSWKLK